MNVLFLSLGEMADLNAHGIYTDLLRQFKSNGHTVYVVTPVERREKKKCALVSDGGIMRLYVKIGNITKCRNIIEKGISTVLIETQYKRAVWKYLRNIGFDLILYSTPPITLAGVVQYIKKRDKARTYLLLKDIFPQNSVDLGMLSKTGLKGLIYKYFRHKEKTLYALSDRIGCMSQANVDYIKKHNPQIPPEKVELCPNAVEPVDLRVNAQERIQLRQKHGLPLDKKLFVYGGNLGRPQDVPFIVECLKACAELEDTHFVIAGSGTDRHFLEEYVQAEKPDHVTLFGHLPKEEYDRMIACCDVGLIFLDHRFTIPNFPSRLLSYMQAGLPVLSCTDPNTDIGKVTVDGGFGWWCESDDTQGFAGLLVSIASTSTKQMADRGYAFLERNYTAEDAYSTIVNTFGD